ncbi:MAG: TonB-dependent receptor [Bacteroidota bacterium]
MKFSRFFLFITFSLFTFSAFTQNKATVSGYIKDARTGEYLIGANVYLKENLKFHATTNSYGFFSMTAEKGDYTLVASFMGYEDYTAPLSLQKGQTITLILKEKVVVTNEVVIKGEKADQNIQSSTMGKVEIPIEKIKTLPALLGEVDVMKTLQLLPGIQKGGEGNSGFYVRGGGPDQNLIMLDEAVVYNASHLFGFFSVFNSDAVKNLELTKGGMPANYGGRLASVLDITMKEGNSREYHMEGGIGVISSRLMVEGPIKKDTSSFIFTIRRTYIDALLKPFVKSTSNFKGSGYYFYDLNGKINYRISPKDRLFLSGYFGKDVFTFKDNEFDFKVSIPWGNATTSARWNHLFNEKLFMNTSLIFSNYTFEFGATQSLYDMKLYSGIRDWNAKTDLTWFPNGLHTVKFGVNYIYHKFIPSNVSAKSGDVEFDLGEVSSEYANDIAIYINDEFDVSEKLKINAGLRGTYFQQIGPFSRYVKNEFGVVVDTIKYKQWEHIADYRHLEPRLNMRYTISDLSSVKASFSQNYQYIHLASLSAVNLPTDTWIPSSSVVAPQFGTQYSLGYFRNFKKNMFESSVELYYKTLKNQVEFKEGAMPEDNVGDNLDNSLTFGEGLSYGSEFFFKKALGKMTGWVGYTLSKTTRTFPEINDGKEFYAKYDRRHDLSVVFCYELNDKWTFSAVFVYATGNAITMPTSLYFINGYQVIEYGDKNVDRMPPYHRADVSATFKPKLKESNKKRKVESTWNFSIYNVYNRYNPYFIYYKTTGSFQEMHLQISAKQVSLFPILPSITWNFKF